MEEQEVSRSPDYMLPNNVYDVLKWIAMIAIPAIAVFVGVVGQAFEWGQVGIAVTVINAVGTLIGALIGVSSKKASGGADE